MKISVVIPTLNASAEIESLLNDAIKSEKFEIAQELNYWLSKLDEKYES